MKQFFQTFFACLAAIVASLILLGIFSTMMFGFVMMAVGSGERVVVKPGTVLMVELSEIITDSPSRPLFSGYAPGNLKFLQTVSLLDVINTIEAASYDDNIQGIYLNINPNMSLGLATMEEIRTELERFKQTGKFIVSYADYYTQSTYYVASVADRIFINPEGNLAWRGMSSQTMFFKGAMDKLGIKAEVVRSGAYKSAVEPFTMDKMSQENRRQTEELVSTIWGNLVSEIANSRGLDSAMLQQYASSLFVRDAGMAYELKLVDSIAYNDQVIDHLAALTGKDDKPNVVPLTGYLRSSTHDVKIKYRNKVAVIYAEGDIVDGKGTESSVGGRTLSHRLRTVRKDDEVKAVVLRVNSPGGSALASEVIWREMELLRREKPLIVSMGDYAASGGYYIAAPADIIFADKNTITGSIGVFGLMLNIEQGMRDKLGITVDGVKTNPSADVGSPFRQPTTAERYYFQNSVDRVYDTFVGHVVSGRNLSRDYVEEIGGGRVWSGVSAADIGLVDIFGGLKDAVLFAADRAGLGEDFKIVTPSAQEDVLTMFLRGIAEGYMLAGKSPAYRSFAAEYDRMERILRYNGIQAAMPYKLEIE